MELNQAFSGCVSCLQCRMLEAGGVSTKPMDGRVSKAVLQVAEAGQTWAPAVAEEA